MTLGNVEQEPDLVDRAKRGDRAAFGELVRIHQHKVYTLAVRLVGDREMAADVTQEAFVKAWRAMPRFRADSAFATWMHRITVNTAWTLQRRARRRRVVPLERAAAIPDDGPTPERSAEGAELRERLEVALAALRPGERAVVVMKDVHGWTHADIADALGASVPATKVRLHRARIRLRRLLAESPA